MDIFIQGLQLRVMSSSVDIYSNTDEEDAPGPRRATVLDDRPLAVLMMMMNFPL